MKTLALLALAVSCVASALAQQSTPKVLICDENAGCKHQFVNGGNFKTLTSDGLTVTVAVAKGRKYTRADVSVFNSTDANVDVLPTNFELVELKPKQKALSYVDAGKVMRSAQRRIAMANALTAMGASMQSQQSTTDTSTSGTIDITNSDGTTSTGDYRGSSTSTTSSPDYAAQERANETIRQNNAALAAFNSQLSRDALRANTVLPNSGVHGFVFFERDKKAQSVTLAVPIGDTVYKFPFTFVRQ
jgi:hypothetical protein